MKYLFPIIAFLVISCGSNCNSLNKNFGSYAEAISTVRNTDFKIEEKVNTDSSWIDSIEYYSCDGKIGYLILNTLEEQSYIHNGVPVEVWEQFKDASSYGRYYNSYIKGNYYFDLKK